MARFWSAEPPERIVQRKGRPPSRKDGDIRECRHHGRTEFHPYKAGGGRVRYRCRRCVAEAVTRRHRRVRAMLVDEAGGRCAICGYDRCILNLHFHHVDPSRKSFSMSVAMGKSLAAVRTEASKCVLLCANCHGEVESGLVKCPPAGATFDSRRAA